MADGEVKRYLDYDGLEHYTQKVKTLINKSVPAVAHTTSEWETTYADFVGENGQICVWTDYKETEVGSNKYVFAGIKIANGQSLISNLNWVNVVPWEYISKVEERLETLKAKVAAVETQVNQVEADLEEHKEEDDIHTTAEEKAAWDKKVTAEVSGDTLLFKF